MLNDTTQPISPFWQSFQSIASSSSFPNITSPSHLLSLITTLLHNPTPSLLSFISSFLSKHPFLTSILLHTSPPFPDLLFSLYFTHTHTPLLSSIHSLLLFLIQSSSIPPSTYKHIFKHFATYYNFYTRHHKSTFQISKESYLEHFRIVELLYKINVNICNDDSVVRNYFYFTVPSQVVIHKYELNANLPAQFEVPKVIYGFVIAMKVYIDNVDNSNNNNEAILTSIEYYTDGSNILEIILTYNPCNVYIKLNKKVIIGPLTVPIKTWIVLKLKMDPNHSTKSAELTFELIQHSLHSHFINNQSITISPYNNVSSISPLTLFKYFTGNLSSFIIFALPPNHNDKYERNLLSLIISDYNINTSSIYKYLHIESESQSIFNHKTKNSCYIDLSSYIIAYFLPLYISHSCNGNVVYLEDFTCHYRGSIINNEEALYANGVMVCENNDKSVDNMGGVDVVVPIMEIICRYKDVLLKDDAEVLERYLMFVFRLWMKSEYNVYEIVKGSVLNVIGMFMESVDIKWKIVNKELVDVLCEMLRNENNVGNVCVLCKMILNKYFILKFEISYQVILMSEISDIMSKHILNETFVKILPDIYELIRIYDNNKHSLYCCIEHKQIFKHEHNSPNTNVHHCHVKEIIIHIATIIKCILQYANDIKHTKRFLNYICLDFSPCVHNAFISLITNLFESNIHISLIYDESVINVLLFRFGNGLPDIKEKIAHLIRKVMYAKIKERYVEGDDEMKMKMCGLIEKMFGYMEMMIVRGGGFIKRKYIAKKDVYKGKVFGVDGRKRKRCSCKNRKVCNGIEDMNEVAYKRRNSSDEIMYVSKEKFMEMINGNSKKIIKEDEIKQNKDNEKINLNTNNNNDNNIISEENVVDTNNIKSNEVIYPQHNINKDLLITTESQETAASITSSSNKETPLRERKRRSFTIFHNKPRKSLILINKHNKPIYKYESVPKGTLPLFYFTNNSNYIKSYHTLYSDLELWLDEHIKKQSNLQFDINIYNHLLSLLTKLSIHSNSIELLEKWCTYLTKLFDNNINTVSFIENNIHLFLYETFTYCTLILKYKYTSILETYSHLTSSQFTPTLYLLLAKTKSLLIKILSKSAPVSSLINHTLHLKQHFPKHLHIPLNTILTEVFYSALLTTKDIHSFIPISQSLYYCIACFNNSSIPNILSNPFYFLTKLICIKDNIWYHYDISKSFVNYIFNYISKITNSILNKKIISQLISFNKNNDNNDIEMLARSIIDLSKVKISDEHYMEMAMLFKMYMNVLFMLILQMTDNSLQINEDILQHYQNLVLYLLVYSVQKYENDENEFSCVLIICYLLLIYCTDMVNGFDAIFVNVTTLLSNISSIAFPNQKGFLSKFKRKEILSNKSPLGKLFLLFTSKLNDQYVFNDFSNETKSEFIKKIHKKIFNDSTLEFLYNAYIKNAFKINSNDNNYNSDDMNGKVFYYYKGISNMKDAFYYKKNIFDYKKSIIECIKERIGNIKKMEIIINKEKVIERKVIRNVYKKKKEVLFQWNNAWSDSDIFYNEQNKSKLKYKILGHYTCDFMRPIITPIMDIDYYLPNFTSFNTTNLFDENQYETNDIYAIDLNIKNIFPINNNNKPFSLSSRNNNSYNNITYTHLLQSYENVTLMHITNQTKPKIKTSPITNNPNINTYAGLDEGDLTLLANALQQKSQIQTQETFCCIVKHSYHIPGKIKIDKSISFEPFSKQDTESKMKFNEYLKNPYNYDHDRKTCFGSIFRSHKKDSDFIPLKLQLHNIKLLFKRNYFYQNTALEIYTYDNKCIFIKFPSQQNRNEFINNIINNITVISNDIIKSYPICINGRSKDIKEFNILDVDDIIGYTIVNNEQCHSTLCISSSSDLYKKWIKYEVSTFAFLMWTNVLGNRSYVDINQYPVFPWVIQDYLNEIYAINDSEFYRDLKMPIGMIVPPHNQERSLQRKLTFIELYNIMLNELRQHLEMDIIENEDDINNNNSETQVTQIPDEQDEYKKLLNDEVVYNYIEKKKISISYEQIPYYYGSHYSNALYINHYLMRIFPYAYTLIELQGNKFDDPQRLFHNMHLTFTSATCQKSDVREICPEFFYFNQMFLNMNNFNFGKAIDITNPSDKAVYKIGNVQLPKWANDNPFVFIEKQRTILEEHCKDIHIWIEMIFGNKQKGKKARMCKNVYVPYSYEGIIKVEEYNEKNLQMNMRLAEMGLCPIKVYYDVLKGRGRGMDGKVLEGGDWREYKGEVVHMKKKRGVPVYYGYDLEKDCIYVVFSDLSRGKINIVTNNKNGEICYEYEKCHESPFTNDKKKTYMFQKIIQFHNYNINNGKYHHTYAIYNKGEVLIVGGFWDGSLLMITNNLHYIINPSYNTHSTLSYLKPFLSLPLPPSPITYIAINDNNTSAYCGTANGNILIFSIEHNTKWIFKQSTHHHTNSIKHIYINNNLQMLASIADDNYVFIYILPSMKVTASMRFEYDEYVPNYVFLSSSPVPCCCLYSCANNEFKIYDINGNYILSVRDDYEEMRSPIIVSSGVRFKDYLVYVNEKGEIVIRSFPFMGIDKEDKMKVGKGKDGIFVAMSKDGKRLYIIGGEGDISILTRHQNE